MAETITYTLDFHFHEDPPTQEQFEKLMNALSCWDLSVQELLEGMEERQTIQSIALCQTETYPRKGSLSPLSDDERIYFNVPYMARAFAKHSHCGFDIEKKLWFTGCKNKNIARLVNLYGINEATSKKARCLLEQELGIGEQLKGEECSRS